jgi:archaemetzincin
MKKTDKDILEKTYGMHKFKIPLKDEQILAMGLAGESIATKKIISHQYEKFYDMIAAPDIGDWLMTHKEYGQNYVEYIRNGIIPIDELRDTIYLAPLSCDGEGGSIDPSFVNSILVICEAYFYGMKVRLLNKAINLKNYEINLRIYEETKLQINANEILECLVQELPKNAYCLLAFTEHDLYNDNNVIKPRNYVKKSSRKLNDVKDSYNFCYGLSAQKYKVAVVSFARYDPLFYSTAKINYESSKHQEKIIKYFFIILKRACKVMIKEICHMFGLKNCIFFQCNMNGFNSMEEFDKKPLEICPVCLRKLYTAISLKNIKAENTRISNPFIIYDRFVKLKDTLSENFLGIYENETIWYSARIESLNSEFN